MSEKPNVFPTNTPATINTKPNIVKPQVEQSYEEGVIPVAEEVYSNAASASPMDAINEMRERTMEQIAKRDEQLKKNKEQIDDYQVQMAAASQRPLTQEPTETVAVTKTTVLNTAPKPIITTNKQMNTTRDTHIEQLSQPQYNMSFDVIPLPSEGKTYNTKKPSVKVAYMTTADENILTSPNLLQSGEFLEILINRKLLEGGLRYRDLLIGDRNAIMLWLRATSYGEMYPVTLLDENDVPFDTEINLNELKVKKMGAEPDAEGYFDFKLSVSKAELKFKLLTVGELEDIDRMSEEDRKNDMLVNNTNTYILERQIVEVNGDRNPMAIKNFIETLRLRDGKELKAYIESIESGVDLELDVRTPGGGSIKTFLPLNVKFFWPDLSI